MSHENEDFNEELNALRENLPEVVEEATPSKSVERVLYTVDLGKRICDQVAQGKSLRAISAQSEMPSYNALLRWSKEHPELSKMLRAVREARARHFEDAAIEAAEAAEGKDADRLKVDTYKWAAEVNDPVTYGKKLAHSGEVKGGFTINVVTGFGPPNPWQTPPKLREDGTIEKVAPKDVASEVVEDVKLDTGTVGAAESHEDSGAGHPGIASSSGTDAGAPEPGSAL